MSQTTINTTDSPETGRVAINANFTELYSARGYQMLSYSSSSNGGTSATQYGAFGSAQGLQSTEIDVFIATRACTVSNLRFYASANTYSNSYTLTLRKNGSTAMTLTITSGTTSSANASDTFTLADGDRLTFNLAGTGGGTGSCVLPKIACLLTYT